MYLKQLLIGKRIVDILCDSEVTILMLSSGTMVTIRGTVVAEPPRYEEMNLREEE